MNVWSLIANTMAVVLYICIGILVMSSKTKQSFASWMLWAAIDTISAAAIICRDGNFELPVIYSIGSTAIAVALLIKKECGWRKFDSYVTVLVITCIIVWLGVGSTAAIIASSAAMVIAGLPMLRDAYESPFDMPVTVYTLATVGNLCGAIAGKDWSIEERLYPLLAFLYTLALVITISWRRICVLRKHPCS